MMNAMVKLAAAFALLGVTACDDAGAPGQYIGYVEAEWVMVAAPQPGWLIETTVAEGDRVEPGMVIAQLDDTLQRARLEEAQSRLSQAEDQLSEARAAVELARTERNRARDLVKRGVSSKARVDKADADYKTAMARLKMAQENVSAASEDAGTTGGAAHAQLDQARYFLTERQLTAKRAGRVEEVFHRTGEFVRAGAPILSLLPDDGLKVRFFVPQKELAALAPGGTVLVRHDGEADAVEASISHIAREAEFTPPVIYSEETRDTLVFLVEARLVNASHLRPGLPVTVTLP